eukprot:746197-Rhodomonas_salina.1
MAVVVPFMEALALRMAGANRRMLRDSSAASATISGAPPSSLLPPASSLLEPSSSLLPPPFSLLFPLLRVCLAMWCERSAERREVYADMRLSYEAFSRCLEQDEGGYLESGEHYFTTRSHLAFRKIKAHEMHTILGVLEAYSHHIANNPYSLLPHWYGIFFIKTAGVGRKGG